MARIKISRNAVINAVRQDDNIGFCLACGAECLHEPDARKQECESCGEFKVYGAQELLLHMVA